MEGYFAENMGVKNLLLADIDTTQQSARIKCDALQKLVIIVNTASAAVNLGILFQQSNAASAGTTKDLAISKSYYVKLAAATSFTKTDLSVADASLVLTELNASAGVVVFEVDPIELDAEGGYYWVSVLFTDPAAARVTSVVAIASDMRNLPAYSVAL